MKNTMNKTINDDFDVRNNCSQFWKFVEFIGNKFNELGYYVTQIKIESSHLQVTYSNDKWYFAKFKVGGRKQETWKSCFDYAEEVFKTIRYQKNVFQLTVVRKSNFEQINCFESGDQDLVSKKFSEWYDTYNHEEYKVSIQVISKNE
jgi:hypothetical protein